MATTPKPPGQRRRRNTEQRQWQTLEGSTRSKPALPRKKPTWLKATREWWDHLWDSPMASTYTEADLSSLYRLARLKEMEARGELKVSALGPLQTLEDRFGLSPKARQMLQWQVPARTNSPPKSQEDELAKRRDRRRRAACEG